MKFIPAYFRLVQKFIQSRKTLQLKQLIKYLKVLFIISFISFITWDRLSTRVPIFGFHDIYPISQASYQSNAPYLDFSAQDLEKFITRLVEDNYWFLSSQDIDNYFVSHRFKIPKSRLRKKAIALSFDDAYKSVATEVLPILQRINDRYDVKIPIILFLNSDRMAKTQMNEEARVKYLSCDDIRVGFKAGFYDLQSSGAGHRILTKDSTEVVIKDLTQMKVWLKQCLGDLNTSFSGQHFAYPYNRVNRQLRQTVSQFHQTAYRYDRRLQRFGWSTRRYMISRLGVRRNTPLWLIWFQAQQASRL